MPRQLRIEYENALYHLLNRGDRREAIFPDDVDRRAFLEILGQTCTKTGWQVHAYCLMGNHFHLVVETPRANLVAGMKWLLGTYTMRFNRRHRLSGHLFAGRYKSLLIDGTDAAYLRTVCDYVHLNPVGSQKGSVCESRRFLEARQPRSVYESLPSDEAGAKTASVRHGKFVSLRESGNLVEQLTAHRAVATTQTRVLYCRAMSTSLLL